MPVSALAAFFFRFCLVQRLQSVFRLLAYTPGTHWSRRTVAGQHLTGWGLPSLRRAVAGQWDAMIPPTDRRRPKAPELTPISSGLLTGNCRLPVLCCRWKRHWSDLSRAQARAMIWRTWDAQSTGPPSLPCWRYPTERTSRYGWRQLGCRSCRKVLQYNIQPP